MVSSFRLEDEKKCQKEIKKIEKETEKSHCIISTAYKIDFFKYVNKPYFRRQGRKYNTHLIASRRAHVYQRYKFPLFFFSEETAGLAQSLHRFFYQRA
jgi:hypothetical protein